MAPKPASQTCWAGGVGLSGWDVGLVLLRAESFDLVMANFLNKLPL
jgi:hypothetical protein